MLQTTKINSNTETEIPVPAEWARQDAVWIGWPHLTREWGDDFQGAQREIADLVKALAPVVTVKVVLGDENSRAEAEHMLGDSVEFHRMPMGDIWLRDTGPIFEYFQGGLRALGFRFNGWGGKYLLDGDTETGPGIAEAEGVSLKRFDFVLEGGAIEHDGAGQMITTRQCLLNANRNPGWNEMSAKIALNEAFKPERLIWLDDGLANDHTDGHVDNLVRFIAPGHVVCQTPSGEDDPNADVLRHVEQALRAAELDVSTIPSPGRVENIDGDVMPASHMNFLISNGRVILPVFEDTNSKLAEAELAALMPEHEVIALPAKHILSGGGAFHCMSQQVPHLETPEPEPEADGEA